MLQFRCANGQGRPPANKGKDVGFRCCSGPANAATVNLAPQKQAPMVEEPAVETNLAAALLKAMPPDHRAVTDASVAFDKVWRWHPRDNEELIIGRWRGTRRTGKPWHELPSSGVRNVRAWWPLRGRGGADKPGAGSEPQRSAPRCRGQRPRRRQTQLLLRHRQRGAAGTSSRPAIRWPRRRQSGTDAPKTRRPSSSCRAKVIAPGWSRGSIIARVEAEADWRAVTLADRTHDGAAAMRKQELVFALVSAHAAQNGQSSAKVC